MGIYPRNFSYFLKENGKIAFVLPRSFFSADHHDNTRSGRAKGFRLTNIWDLSGVAPLFRIPSCALFAEKAKRVKKGGEEPTKWKEIPASGLEGKSFSGKLPAHNCNFKAAISKLSEVDEKWFCVRQGKSTAFSVSKSKPQTKVNPYKKLFKQGATIVPRTFYFVDVDMAYEKGWEKDFDWADRIINVKTSDTIQPDAKAPWKGLKFSGRIESCFLFRTALSKSILPFALFKPNLVALPITIENIREEEKKIKLYSVDEIGREGYLNASKWFGDVERIWSIHSTEKNKNISATDYLNWQNKLTDQNLNAPYLVLYNASAKDANATVVKRKNLDLEFLVESTGYSFVTSIADEAYYLTSILNSSVPNLQMKDFQARGLFGARHVHKKILDIFYPKFDKKNETHLRLAELSKDAHTKTAKFLKTNPPKQELSAIFLGKLRKDIKNNLTTEMKEIDKLVKKIIG